MMASDLPARAASRRLFLAAAAGTGAALSLPLQPSGALGCALAAGRRPIKLVVVSDTHLGYKSNEAAETLWARTAAEIAAIDADLVLHLGDLVDGGQEPLYPHYLKHRGQIKAPV